MADSDDGLPVIEPGEEVELICADHEEDGVRVFWDGQMLVVICHTCEDVLKSIRCRERIH